MAYVLKVDERAIESSRAQERLFVQVFRMQDQTHLNHTSSATFHHQLLVLPVAASSRLFLCHDGLV
jgi:hypothetical protein